MTKGLCDVTFASACGAVEQDMLSLFDEGAGGQIPDELVIDFRVEGEIETL